MGPVKFDDLSKTAKDVLSEDYAVQGTSFKSKSKTSFEGWNDVCTSVASTDESKKQGAILTTAIDLNFNGKCATPAKLTWKFPKPLGLAGLAFDKLEVDKAGKMKLEASMDKALHGVPDFKVECKSDLKTLDSLTVGAAYTGLADALCKAEFKATNPADYSAEVSYVVGGGATVAMKSSTASTVDVGLQYVNGPMFGSVTGLGMLTAFTFHGYYKACSDLKLACNYSFGGKANGQFAAGLAYDLCPGTSLKGKLTGSSGADLAVSTSVKKELAKGMTVTAGANVPFEPSKAWTWGMAFNIE